MTAPTNTVTWWELPTQDLASAKAFYADVFGWTFVPFGGDAYAGITNGEELIGGLFQTDEPPAEAGSTIIRVYVNVSDLEGVFDKATSAGGAIAVPRTEIGGDMGWWAAITSPTGEWLGLCTGSRAKS